MEGSLIAIKISPSILASDFSRLGEQVRAVEHYGADMIHLDVMDGHFVPNISFGPAVIKSIRGLVSIPFDAHLMISHPLSYIGVFADAGCDILTFHGECCSDISQTLDEIRKHGMGSGLSVKPATPPEVLFPYLERLDQVLVMTVEPGFGGQAFMNSTLTKISALRKEIDRRGLDTQIEVDGGIDRTTAPLAIEAGASILVAGSSVYKSEDYSLAIRRLRGDLC